MILSLAILQGCASREVCLRPVGDHDLTPAEVAASGRGVGEVVTWGGMLVETRNLVDRSEAEVVGYPLDRCGRPLIRSRPLGRFLVRYPGYLEAADYRPGRQVTATGRVVRIHEDRDDESSHPVALLDEAVVRLWTESDTTVPVYGYPTRPWISIGIGGGSGGVGGGVGVSF